MDFDLFTAIFPNCKAARKFLAENPSVGITPNSRDYIETTEVRFSIEGFDFQNTCPMDVGKCKLIIS